MALSTKQMSRSHISSFVHSLHLLDLDLLQDWPGISKETFDSKSNLQHRLRCVEWSLYRLFELYDPRVTKEKLLPFFPPATSLQSINLRAALFRQLSELKKDGRLGPSVVLRKTMLDECKGDKFEELVSAFSILVLKKVKGSHVSDSYDVFKTQSKHLLPLIISHRKVVEQDLVKRKELRLRAQRQQRSLEAELESLAVEESETKQTKVPKLSGNVESLRRSVHENWIGDAQWADAVLYGCPPNVPLSSRSIADQEVRDNDGDDRSPPDVLHDLSLRVSNQNARLAHWQNCLKNIKKNPPFEDSIPGEQPQRVKTVRFSRHHSLDSELQIGAEEQCELNPQHVALLESLERGLTQPPKRHQVLAVAQREVKSDIADTLLFKRVDLGSFGQDKDHDLADTKAPSVQCNHKENAHVQSIGRRGVPSARVEAFQQQEAPQTPPRLNHENSSLLERTKASLAHLTSHGDEVSEVKEFIKLPGEKANPTVVATRASMRPDRTSLLERTRESMSLLTSAFEDSSRRKSGARKSFHSKSKSVNVPSQTRRLEGAWSEQPIAPKTAKDDFDVHADYDSVFKSRPKLAMSPNLSPQRNDLFDEFLEEGMKKLTIEPTS